MALIQFGDFDNNLGYATLNERAVRASSGIMLVIGIWALVNAFVLRNFIVVPWVSGILLVNFAIAVFINPRLAPIYALATWVVRKQTPLPIGAIQKRFAWSLGLVLASTIFGLSFMLLADPNWFGPVCMLCVLCNMLLFLESAFGICVGCKLYGLAVRVGLLKQAEVKPNCMGDACKI